MAQHVHIASLIASGCFVFTAGAFPIAAANGSGLDGSATPTPTPAPTVALTASAASDVTTGFKINGCVVHFSGCGGSREFGTVYLSPLGLTADVDTGYFYFDSVPPGEYVLTYSPSCNPAGCTRAIRLQIVDHDEHAAFYRYKCVADCSGDGEVTIDEVIGCLRRALGRLGGCSWCDENRNGQVTIDEMVRGIRDAIGGCGSY